MTCSTSKVCYGVCIDALDAKDLLARAGLKSSMVITKVDDTEVSEHEHAMELMNAAKAAEKKVKLECLTEDEAAAQGKIETAKFRKGCLAGFLIFVAIILLVCAMVAAGYIQLPDFNEISKKMAEAQTGQPGAMGLEEEMAKWQGGMGEEQMEKMKHSMEKMMGDQMTDEMRENMRRLGVALGGDTPQSE